MAETFRVSLQEIKLLGNAFHVEIGGWGILIVNLHRFLEF